MEIIIGIISALLIASIFAIRNLVRKNEMLEDFIAKQSEAINRCNQRLNQIDEKGSFASDDEIGWFFNEVKKIQEALNEFRLR
jgi:hypothetical protein